MKRTALSVAAAFATISVLAGPVAAHGVNKGGFGDRAGFPAGLFGQFDGNGDEAVTMDEINAAWAERFSDADVDGDGQLSAEEMAGVIEVWRAERQASRIRSLIEHNDSDDDGLLSLEEATAAIQTKRFDRLFERLDADGDGAVTTSEIDEMGDRRWFGRGRGHRH